MKIQFTKYQISGTAGKQTVLEQGTAEIPKNGHGTRYNLRQIFPGFDISRQTAGTEIFRMHNADWTIGIAVASIH